MLTEQPMKVQRSQAHHIDGTCIRLKPKRSDHAEPYEYVHRRTDDGNGSLTLKIFDGFDLDSRAARVKRKLNTRGVAQIVIEAWRNPLNTKRPRSAVSYRNLNPLQSWTTGRS